MQSACINGTTLHLRQTSSAPGKPNLVFINSLGTGLRIWDGVSAGLRNQLSILAYDKRGHGLSDLGHAPYAVDHHVDDLERLMDHLGLGSSSICGLSVGGQIALGLGIPALCIVGAEDAATPPALVEDMARMIPHSRFHIIDGCGDIPCLERPGELIQLIAEFMTTGRSEVAHD